MIFAAGEGRRMLPLTKDLPKPLLEVAGMSLLEHQIRRLELAGCTEVIINVAYLSDKIVRALDEMKGLDMNISVSKEPEPLETGGALLHAKALLGDEVFLLVNADVWSEFDYRTLIERGLNPAALAHLVLIPNPDHNHDGDFCLNTHRSVERKQEGNAERTFTFSGISLIDPRILDIRPSSDKKFPLRDLLNPAMDLGRVTGELYEGFWLDVGTPERLTQLRNRHSV
jgi:MurNAc alpha-1-phosphate uridylyltransferase